MQRWARQQYPAASQVGAWWGPALNKERRAKTRFTKEIDLVGLKSKNLVVAGEAKWTTKALGHDSRIRLVAAADLLDQVR